MPSTLAGMLAGTLAGTLADRDPQIDGGASDRWMAPLIGGKAITVAPVDAVGLEGRAAALAGRSIKQASKLAVLDLVVRCMDLTTLEGADTPGKVKGLCAKALRPDPSSPGVPAVAAVCVYPLLVPVAVRQLRGSAVRVASVAAAFPAGQSPIKVRLAEIGWAVAAGADEVDIVLDRGAFLSGRYRQVFDDIVAAKEACGGAHLKVILETGELGSYDTVRKASMLAMVAGADFIKTSTGKIAVSATFPVTLCMAEAIRDFAEQSGRAVGLKLAGDIRTAKQAWQHLVIVAETLGPDWMSPDRLRLGASSLLNDVCMQVQFQRTGRYQRLDHFSLD